MRLWMVSEPEEDGGQRAAHHGDSGTGQPSLGAPPPGVSGGGAPDQRTARLWRKGGGHRVGGRMRVRPRRRGLGIRGPDRCGTNREQAGFSLTGTSVGPG